MAKSKSNLQSLQKILQKVYKMPQEHKYYLCEFCGKNFGNDYEGCRKHEKEHKENKLYKILLPKDATDVTVEIISNTNGRMENFVYQTSSYFYIIVKNKEDIKAAFEKLKEEAIRYYNIMLERDKKALNTVNENLKKLEINDDESKMQINYYTGL